MERQFLFICAGFRDDSQGIMGGPGLNEVTHYNNTDGMSFTVQYREPTRNIFGVLLHRSNVPTVRSTLPPGNPVVVEFLVTDACGDTTLQTRTVRVGTLLSAVNVDVLAEANAALVDSVTTTPVEVSLGTAVKLSSVLATADALLANAQASSSSTQEAQDTQAAADSTKQIRRAARENLIATLHAITLVAGAGGSSTGNAGAGKNMLGLTKGQVSTVLTTLESLTSSDSLPMASSSRGTTPTNTDTGTGTSGANENDNNGRGRSSGSSTLRASPASHVVITPEAANSAISTIRVVASATTESKDLDTIIDIGSNLVNILKTQTTSIAINVGQDRNYTESSTVDPGPKYTKQIVEESIVSIEKVMATLIGTMAKRLSSSITAVSRTSADGSLQIAASKSDCGTPATVDFGGSRSSFSHGANVCRFQKSSQNGVAGRRNRRSNSIVTHGIQYASSPYLYADREVHAPLQCVIVTCYTCL